MKPPKNAFSLAMAMVVAAALLAFTTYWLMSWLLLRVRLKV